MKKFLTLLGLFISATSFSQTYVVPPAFQSTAGGAGFLGPLSNAQRTYQLLIHQSQLTGLAGKKITGISFRILPSATSAWPASAVTYSTYDIYLSGSVDPSMRSLAAFANNVVPPQEQVRSGPLLIPAASFPSGGSPNDFGMTIPFDNSYTYDGGNLLLEIRHQGSNGNSASVDAVGSTNTSAGSGTLFHACWQGNYTGTVNVSNGNSAIVKFVTETPLPVMLSGFNVLRMGQAAKVKWQTLTEENALNFEVQRSVDGRQFETLATIPAKGAASIYDYADATIQAVNAPVVYYRLKMIDKDGSFTTSIIVPLNLKSKSAIVMLYPNPVKDAVNVTLSALQNETVQYNIIGIEGRVLQTARQNLVTGDNTILVHTTTLPPGNYLITVKGAYTNTQVPFIKQ